MAFTGTFSLDDLKAQPPGVTIDEFGEAEAAAVVRAEIDAHNARYQDMIAALMVTTTERTLTYGGGTTRKMRRFDENGRLATKKGGFKGGTYGLPYDQFGDALGWNLDYIQTTTVPALALEVTAMQDADVETLYSAVQAALLVPTNYTWYDQFVDQAELQVKRLLNGDGSAIPNNRAGEVFNPANHTHYLASGSWTNEAIDAQIATVREHDHTGNIVIYINVNNVPNISALSKFMPARKDRVIYGADQTVANVTLDPGARDDNRVIGLWDGLYDIVVKPWMIAGYTFVHDTLGPKPLTMRLPVAAVQQGLRLVGDIDIYPLRANYYARRFGVGVGERTNGAVTWMGGAVYQSPAGFPADGFLL